MNAKDVIVAGKWICKICGHRNPNYLPKCACCEFKPTMEEIPK